MNSELRIIPPASNFGWAGNYRKRRKKEKSYVRNSLFSTCPNPPSGKEGEIIHNFPRSGFTLVEMIIAVGLFAFAISVIVGVFSQALRSQKILNSLIQLNSNAGLMMEQIMREIRLGYSFSQDPNSGCGKTLTFNRIIEGKKSEVIYQLITNNSSSSIERSEQKPPGSASVKTILNASNINVSSLCFNIKQTDPSYPWLVTMYFRVDSKDKNVTEKPMYIQTTVSSRTLPRDFYQ
ncbi:MAG: type II secretion system protein [Patescibacteria group bacterium]